MMGCYMGLGDLVSGFVYLAADAEDGGILFCGFSFWDVFVLDVHL